MAKKTLLKARGILKRENDILFCYNKAQNFYFLPGGSLEVHENIPQCLERELQEECQLSVSVGKFLGCLECHWQEGPVQYQELDWVFQLHAQKHDLPAIVQSLEDHISFVFLNEMEIKKGKHHILPKGITQFLHESSTPQYLFENQL